MTRQYNDSFTAPGGFRIVENHTGGDERPMCKENTHLWFARGLLDDCTGTALPKDVSDHLSGYLLGAVIPDTFFYGPGKTLPRISESFHGKDGNPTNTIIIQVLDAARGPRDMAFILGYITHCALDITFHPVIYSLAGNYYDNDPGKRKQAAYRHRHLETCLDRDLDNAMRLHRLVRTSHLHGLVFEEIVSRSFQVSIAEIRQSLGRQIFFNRLFTSRGAYSLAKMAVAAGMADDPSYLGLFYADAARDERFPASVSFADPVDRREKRTSAPELFMQARVLAGSMMEAAHAYWRDDIDREALIQAVPGLSLDTGRLGVAASGLRP